MNTIVGKIEDAAGNPVTAILSFAYLSAPQVFGSGSIVIPTVTESVQTNPNDGTFSIGLLAGNYTVTINSNASTNGLINAAGSPTTFTISIVGDGNTYQLGSIISSGTPTLPVTPPNTIFNGILNGNLTFNYLTPPPAPTTQPVAFTGGGVNSVGGERYSYWASYVTALGETDLSPVLQVTESLTATPNLANRIFVAAGQAGTTAIHIWRTYLDNGHVYSGAPPQFVGLVATIAPNVPYYDDWETTAQFAARVVTPPVNFPYQNTTAGKIITTIGGAGSQTLAWVTPTGIVLFQQVTAPDQVLGDANGVITKRLLDLVLGGGISTSDVLFRLADGQIQMYDVVAAQMSSGLQPWIPFGVNNGTTVLGASVPATDPLDDPFALPAGANYRFANGQVQFWDAVAAVTDATKPWRAVGVSAAAVYWSAPIADAGAILDTLPNPPNANWRVKNGQFQIWDQVQARLDMSRPWRALGVNNGIVILSNPISH